jgi:hypothetical protein
VRPACCDGLTVVRNDRHASCLVPSFRDDVRPLPPELSPWLGALPRVAIAAPLAAVVELDLPGLTWLLDLPLLPGSDGTPFRVRPLDVVDGPHLALAEHADLTVPLEVAWVGDRFVVLDGLYRLLKAARLGRRTVPARVVASEVRVRRAA